MGAGSLGRGAQPTKRPVYRYIFSCPGQAQALVSRACLLLLVAAVALGGISLFGGESRCVSHLLHALAESAGTR